MTPFARRTERPIRVLHVSTRAEGGVKVLAEMIDAGLAPHGIVSEHRVLIPAGAGPKAVLKACAGTVFALAIGRHDAVFAYQSAASILAGLVGSVRRTRVRVSHLTALPVGLKARWAGIDRWLGVRGAYTHIIANCEATRRAYAHYPAAYRARITTIAHGVTPLCPAPRPRDWRRHLGLPAHTPLLVATGRLAEQKDFATAIAALPRLPDAHLVIAGEGPLRGALIDRAEALGVSDRVHLPGNLARETLHALVSQADAYVFPSVWESFGLAGAEALMAGTPVIAADLAVLREVLGLPGLPPGTARFHPVGDEKGLATQLRAVLNHPPRWAQRREAARIACAHHAPERMASRFRDLLVSALRRQAQGDAGRAISLLWPVKASR